MGDKHQRAGKEFLLSLAFTLSPPSPVSYEEFKSWNIQQKEIYKFNASENQMQ